MSLRRSSSMTRITEEKGTPEEEVDEPTMPASDEDGDEAVNGGDDDDDDSSEDENAHLKQLKPSQISIRRNDSFTSFLTRSERAALLGKDKPPSPEEARQRKVKFVEDNLLETVHEIDLVPVEDKPSVYMDGDDFSRIETDLKMTSFRWENHLSGHIPFDDNTNSMRGLEHLSDRPAANKKELAKYKHNRAVLEEINRQKQDYGGEVRDWDVVRKTSMQFSVHSINHAVEVGRQDREAHQRAWSTESSHSSQASDDDKKADKKKKPKFRFWQKK